MWAAVQRRGSHKMREAQTRTSSGNSALNRHHNSTRRHPREGRKNEHCGGIGKNTRNFGFPTFVRSGGGGSWGRGSRGGGFGRGGPGEGGVRGKRGIGLRRSWPEQVWPEQVFPVWANLAQSGHCQGEGPPPPLPLISVSADPGPGCRPTKMSLTFQKVETD